MTISIISLGYTRKTSQAIVVKSVAHFNALEQYTKQFLSSMMQKLKNSIKKAEMAMESNGIDFLKKDPI